MSKMNFIKLLFKNPYVIIVSVVVITLILGSGVSDLKIDNDLMNMLPENHPAKVEHERMNKEFGKAEMIMIGVFTDNIFRKDFLKEVDRLTGRLRKIKIPADPASEGDKGGSHRISCIEEVLSLSTVPYISGSEWGMETGNLMEKVPSDSAEMYALMERAFSWDYYRGSLLTKDSSACMIAVELKPELSADEWMRVVDKVKEVAEDSKFGPGVSLHIAGEPFVSAMINKYIIRDIKLLLPVVFAVVFVFLFISMRSFFSSTLILIAIFISVIWSMGIMALAEVPVSLISSAIPVLLVAIASAYSIHIIKHYTDLRHSGKDPKTAIESSLNLVGTSVAAAAMTTAAGFFSLAASDIVPIRDFGLFTAFGTLAAFAVSLIFVPAALVLFDSFFKKAKNPLEAGKKSGIDFTPTLINIAEKCVARRSTVFVFSGLIAVGAIFFSFKIYPDMVLVNFFRDESSVKKSDMLINDKFSGTTTMAVAIDGAEPDFFKRPQYLEVLDSFKTFLLTDGDVGMVLTFADYVKRMHYAMNSEKAGFESVPPSAPLISQYLLLYGNSEDLESVVSYDYSKSRVIVTLKNSSIRTLKRIKDAAEGWLVKRFPDEKISFAGTSRLAMAVNRMVVTGQIRSLLFSVISVFIIASFVFRSAKWGLLSVLPLSFSVIMNFGIMGLTGMPLDVGTAIIAGVAIGTGVDYSIHFLNGVRHASLGQAAGYDWRSAIKLTGNAVVFNATSVAAGFLVLLFSSFIPLVKLGVFIAFTMFTASVGTLFLLPAVLSYIGSDNTMQGE
ncbi:MAG: efflux RND transporter permease subunit [Fibrobacterota bacterium]